MNGCGSKTTTKISNQRFLSPGNRVTTEVDLGAENLSGLQTGVGYSTARMSEGKSYRSTLGMEPLKLKRASIPEHLLGHGNKLDKSSDN